jgi:tetratricopeptide (TPR) repeat protein
MGSSFSQSTDFDRKSLKQSDGFISTIRGLFDTVNHHSKATVVGMGTAILLGLGVTYMMNHNEAQAESARNLLYSAQKTLEIELKTIADQIKPKTESKKTDVSKVTPVSPLDTQASLETVAHQPLNVDSQLPETVKKLKEVDEKFGKTRAAFDARLKLGNLYFEHGEVTKSIPWFEKAADTAPGNLEKAMALSAIAYAYENSGKPNDAIQAYQKAINLGEGSLKGDLLMGIARSHEANHDSAKARSTYDQILTDLPGTDYAKSAEAYKAQL